MKDIAFTPQAYADYLDWLKKDKKIFRKITSLIMETARTPETGTGKPEALKHDLKGYWSRRITKEHRLVYQVTNQTITIISCNYHYSK